MPVAASELEWLVGRRMLIGAKEAGAASLLAAMSRIWHPGEQSACLTSAVGEGYFRSSQFSGRMILADVQHAADAEIEKIMDTVSPEIVVVGASAGDSVEKDLMACAQRREVRVFSFVDHYWNLWQRFADSTTARRWAHLPDLIFVPAQPCADRMAQQGCPRDRIRIFEHPLLTRPERGNVAERMSARRALGLNADETVVMFVSEYGFGRNEVWQWEEPEPEIVENLLSVLLQGALEMRRETGGRIRVLIKRHPAEQHGWEHACAKFPQELSLVIGNCPKDMLFGAVDCAFGLNSMLLLEAACAGVPTYSFHGAGGLNQARLSDFRTEIVELASSDDCWRVMREHAGSCHR